MVGEHVRILRESQNLLLRELAAELKMDTAMLSKMERGQRPFRKEDIEKLSKALKVNQQELYKMWLADKILRTTGNDEHTKDALKIALKNCESSKNN